MSYLYLQSQTELESFCTHCAACSWIAVDTEFLRQDTYFPLLSLVQIESEQGQAAIIDPLALEDLSPLWQLLANAEVCKVFHSARQDIEVLYHASQTMLQNLFDTQTAAIFFGYGDLAGFARVVEGELGLILEKAETRTNWHQRPLTDAQLEYAYHDVHYLAPLYRQFQEKLTSEQKAVVQSDFDELLDESLYKADPSKAGGKLKGLKALSGKHLTIAHELASWREAHAIKNDEPRKWVISDDVITSIAKRPPKTADALYKVPNIKPSSVKAFGAEWVKLIDQVFANPESWKKRSKTPPPPLSENDKISLEACLLLAKLVANNNKVNPSNLINKNEVIQILKSEQEVLSGWRSLLIEKPLRAFLSGKSSLSCHNKQLQLSNISNS